jgi:hypothetical protein
MQCVEKGIGEEGIGRLLTGDKFVPGNRADIGKRRDNARAIIQSRT